MNTFNRLAMSLILLGSAVVIALLILVVLFAPGALAPYFTNAGRILAGSSKPGDLDEIKVWLTGFGLIMFVPLMVLLWLEIRRTARNSIRITKVGTSEASLSMQAVAQSLVYYVDALAGVVRVRPRLNADAKSVSVRLDVETTPDVDVRAKTDEIASTARAVIEERLGLTLKSLQIQLHHTSFPRAGTVKPVAPTSPPAQAARVPVQTAAAVKNAEPAVTEETKSPAAP